MASDAIAATPAAGMDGYRQAEQALWRHYGLEPKERFIEIQQPAARLRILEVGSGEPVLFVHGTVGPGSWPSLVAELPGYRCLVIDRPGWGFSSPVDYAKGHYPTMVADILRRALDALDIDRAHLVGGSIGNVWALRLAAQHPARVATAVLLGGSPLVPDVPIPGIIRLIASPLGALVVRLPDSAGRVRSILTQSGHGPSLEDGRIPDVFVDWRVAVGRQTESMRRERDMIRALVHGSSFRPGVTFDDEELAAIERPTLYVFGSADPVGTVETWRRAARVLPQGELHIVEDAGHMPWFDASTEVANEMRRFMAR
jgi:pimeloyl-ACP methyl ester carboxylesterase